MRSPIGLSRAIPSPQLNGPFPCVYNSPNSYKKNKKRTKTPTPFLAAVCCEFITKVKTKKITIESARADSPAPPPSRFKTKVNTKKITVQSTRADSPAPPPSRFRTKEGKKYSLLQVFGQHHRVIHRIPIGSHVLWLQNLTD